MPRKRQYIEEALQKSVVEYLRWALPSDAVCWATPNQRGTRARWENELLKAMGVLSGYPDLSVLHQGHLVCIELKAPGRTNSGVQKAVHGRLRDAGAHVHTCHSLGEVATVLELEGIPLKARLKAA